MDDLSCVRAGNVAIVEICRGPSGYFDAALIEAIAARFEACDEDPEIRVILLCSEGRNFCAGANFTGADGRPDAGAIYRPAVRLFRSAKPIVVAMQGAAVGGGLGLAMVGDFRVASAESRLSANFSRLGIHPGFGLSVTLPRAIGAQQAALLLYTGRRIDGVEAKAIGLVDLLVPEDELRSAALALATELAGSAPLALVSMRATLRAGLADSVAAVLERERTEQERHFQTADFAEGVAAAVERRAPLFTGR